MSSDANPVTSNLLVISDANPVTLHWHVVDDARARLVLAENSRSRNLLTRLSGSAEVLLIVTACKPRQY